MGRYNSEASDLFHSVNVLVGTGILASCEVFGTQKAVGYLEQSALEKLLGEEFGVPLSSDYHLGAFWDYLPNARDNDASSVHKHVLDGFIKRWNASQAFVNGNVRVRGGAPMTSALQWVFHVKNELEIFF